MSDKLARNACQPCREGATWNTRGACAPLPTCGRGWTFPGIERIVSAQRVELEMEIGKLKAEAKRIAEEVRELAGEVPF